MLPLRTFASKDGKTAQIQAGAETAQSIGDNPESDRVGLKEADEIESGSMQNPHDMDATYHRKGGESHRGYKSNVAETCGGENPFRLITTVRVGTNNTDDGDLLAEDVAELPNETGLSDLLVDGGYTHRDVESRCGDHEITQHFTGLTGQRPSAEKLSLADAEWDGHRMVACPASKTPSMSRCARDALSIQHHLTELPYLCQFSPDRFRGCIRQTIVVGLSLSAPITGSSEIDEFVMRIILVTTRKRHRRSVGSH
ncbi:hypothetical protein [Halococcus sediminicola]|uniref:hypothetical protein n=1 Tax=Halococcus sediminicola TaxID=1264579 RepID=UPI00067893C8|nr:hypothetical protein [Halococcus sediminicola]